MRNDTDFDMRKLAAARLRVMIRRPYYAAALNRLSTRRADALGTFAVDRWWRLYVDPQILNAWSVEEVAAVLEHELGHLIRAHAMRAARLGVQEEDRLLFNVVSDAEINDDLDAPLPGSPVKPEDFGAPPGGLAESYFSHLRTNVVLSEDVECGSGCHGLARSFEDAISGDAIGDIEADLIRRSVAFAIRAHDRRHGLVPAGLQRWATEMLDAKVDWRQVLGAAVRHAAADVAGQVDYSYRRPSRRTGATPGVILPALRRPLPSVAAVVDTSGSMLDEELGQALAEVEGIVRGLGLPDVTLFSCDVDASSPTRVRRAAQATLIGGGGTDVGHGLEVASRGRPRPAVVIALTDGYTPWPEGRPSASIKYVVVIVGDGPAGPPWARTLRISQAEERSER